MKPNEIHENLFLVYVLDVDP